MAVAHDILEHFPGGGEAPHDEFMALGAGVFVRGIPGYFQNQTPADNLCSDFPEIFSHIHYEKMGLRDGPYSYKLRDEDAEQMIQATIQKARIRLLDEWIEHSGLSQTELDQYLHTAMRWMRAGYRKAVQRFRNVNSFEFPWLFQNIEQEADKILKHAEEQDELHVKLVRNQVDVIHYSYYELHPEEY